MNEIQQNKIEIELTPVEKQPKRYIKKPRCKCCSTPVSLFFRYKYGQRRLSSFFYCPICDNIVPEPQQEGILLNVKVYNKNESNHVKRRINLDSEALIRLIEDQGTTNNFNERVYLNDGKWTFKEYKHGLLPE